MRNFPRTALPASGRGSLQRPRPGCRRQKKFELFPRDLFASSNLFGNANYSLSRLRASMSTDLSMDFHGVGLALGESGVILSLPLRFEGAGDGGDEHRFFWRRAAKKMARGCCNAYAIDRRFVCASLGTIALRR